MEIFSKTEEMILLAVWKLHDSAYGVTIRKYLIEMTAKNLSIGGIYVPLDRLVRKGHLDTFQGEPTPERGGMSKRYFRLTREGQKALSQAKEIHEKMWTGLPDLGFEQG